MVQAASPLPLSRPSQRGRAPCGGSATLSLVLHTLMRGCGLSQFLFCILSFYFKVFDRQSDRKMEREVVFVCFYFFPLRNLLFKENQLHAFLLLPLLFPFLLFTKIYFQFHTHMVSCMLSRVQHII